MFFPKDKMNVTNVNKHCQPRWNVAFIISKLNVLSLQNSHWGCKTNVSVCKLWPSTSSKRQMLHKHAKWIFGWWISVIRLGCKRSVFWHPMRPVEVIHPQITVLQLSVLDISRKHRLCVFDIIYMHDLHDMEVCICNVLYNFDILSAHVCPGPPMPGRTSTPLELWSYVNKCIFFPHLLIQLNSHFSPSFLKWGSLRVRSKNKRRKRAKEGRLQSRSHCDKCILGELSC